MINTKRGPLRAGAAKVDITPQELEGLTNLWQHPFEGVHDPIFLRALVVENGINTAAIVAADLVEFGDTCAIRTRMERELGNMWEQREQRTVSLGRAGVGSAVDAGNRQGLRGIHMIHTDRLEDPGPLQHI